MLNMPSTSASSRRRLSDVVRSTDAEVAEAICFILELRGVAIGRAALLGPV
jgi:hypothetical protein